jgi:HSP20 family protein
MNLRSLVPFSLGGLAPRGDDPFVSLHREIDRLFDDFSRGMPLMRWPTANGGVDLRVDVSETDKEIKVTAELPGVDEKDIEVTLAGDLLTIKGEKKAEQERKEEKHHVIERSYGAFARSLRLPYAVEEKNVQAEFKKGVLTITLPKPAEVQAAAKKIAVKTGK